MTQKYCPSYWGYSVTDDSHVFTHRKRYGKGKGHGGGVVIDWQFERGLNQYRGQGGYLYVSISDGRKQRSIPIHVLLLDAFVGKRPPKSESRHLDGNPLNNKLNNLAYGTRKENADDRIRCGNHAIGVKHGRALLTEEQVHFIRRLYFDGHRTVAYIARYYGRGESTIRDIVKGRHWKHI